MQKLTVTFAKFKTGTTSILSIRSSTNSNWLPFIATYCVQYPHAVPFMRNKMSYRQLKPPKIHAI